MPKRIDELRWLRRRLRERLELSKSDYAIAQLSAQYQQVLAALDALNAERRSRTGTGKGASPLDQLAARRAARDDRKPASDVRARP